MSDTDDYPGGWFGNTWGAPVCDYNARHLPTPVGEKCMDCEKTFVDGDQGLTIPHASATRVNLRSMHIDCFRRGPGIE